MYIHPSGFRRRTDGREEGAGPINNSLTALDSVVREWGLRYKKINDSTTSQFTVGPLYEPISAAKPRSFPLVRVHLRQPSPRIANFSTRRDTEEVGTAYL